MTASPIRDRLHEEVAAFRAGQFELASDLAHLIAVHERGASEAAIFYAGRVIEVLAAERLRRGGLAPKRTLLSNLLTLERARLVPPYTGMWYWSHALRRLGNDVRHVLRRVEREDAEVAAALVEPCLRWFFCSAPGGPGLVALTSDDRDLGLATHVALRAFVAKLESGSASRELDARTAASLASEELLAMAPALPALLAQVLLDRGGQPERDHAGALLAQALRRFPGHMRLRQLEGLRLSRLGRLEEAFDILEELYEQNPTDPETAGILGGAVKRRWRREKDPKLLERAQGLYEKAWVASEKADVYTGVNAAALRLLRDDRDGARVIAGQVRDFLQDVVGLCPAGELPAGTGSHWDRLTRAEAELLMGNIDTAKGAYQRAFAMLPVGSDQIRVAREQVELLLPKLGNVSSAWFFDDGAEALEAT